MAFKKKNVDKKFLKYSDCTENEVIAEGVYEKTGESKFGITHEFRTEENFMQVLNSAGHLNYLLNEYAVFGDYCKVTYDGIVVLEKGAMKGKNSHNFTLEIDDDKFDTSFARDTSKQSKTPPKSDSEPTCDVNLEDMTL
jgi:hypothetical protein